MHPLNKDASASTKNYHFIALHETERWLKIGTGGGLFVVNEVINLLGA
jgi:hypothetical protein